MIQALMLKIAALSLLLLIGQNPSLPEDFRAQAETVAQQALAAADAELSSTSTIAVAPQPSPSSEPSATTSTAQTTGSSISNNTPVPMPEPVSQARIEIVSPLAGKGLGRTYKAAPEITDESNYIELGALVYDAAGNPLSTADVAITVNGGTPIVLKGTGDMYTHYVDSQKRVDPVYSLHYEFKQSGDVTFVFEANGMSKSVTVSVQ